MEEKINKHKLATLRTTAHSHIPSIGLTGAKKSSHNFGISALTAIDNIVNGSDSNANIKYNKHTKMNKIVTPVSNNTTIKKLT